jgi:hypothetical protein
MSALHLRNHALIESATLGSSEAREEVIDGDAGDLNFPAHYRLRDGKQSLDFIESTLTPEQFEGFLRANAMKYLIRYDKKGTPKADVAKALDYLQRLQKVVNA